jgi:heat shock protein HtpX
MGNQIRTTFLLALLTGLILLIGQWIGGRQGMFIALLVAAGMNFFSYWFSDKIVLKMYRAQEVGPQDGPELYGMVQELCRRAGLPMPKVYVIPQEAPNAFATGRNPEHAAVAVTEGLLKRMMLADMARWSAIFGGGQRDREEGGGVGGLGLILMSILAPLGAMLIQMAISRSREYLADATGAAFAGTPEGLARALEKLGAYSRQLPMDASPATAHMFIVNPLSGRSLMHLFSTHPPLEERIARLRGLRFNTPQPPPDAGSGDRRAQARTTWDRLSGKE